MQNNILKIEQEINEKRLEFKANNPILFKKIDHITQGQQCAIFEFSAAILRYKLNHYLSDIDTEIKALFNNTIHKPAIQKAIIADLMAIKDRDPAADSYLNILLNYKGFHATIMHRISHDIWHNHHRDLALF